MIMYKVSFCFILWLRIRLGRPQSCISYTQLSPTPLRLGRLKGPGINKHISRSGPKDTNADGAVEPEVVWVTRLEAYTKMQGAIKLRGAVGLDEDVGAVVGA